MKSSVTIAAALGGAGCFAALCAEAQQGGPAVAELYQRASRLAVSAEEAERELGAASRPADIVAGLASVLAPAVAAGPSGTPAAATANPAAAIVPASTPATSRR